MPKRKSLIKGAAEKKALAAASVVGGLTEKEAIKKILKSKGGRAAILAELDSQGL